LALSGKLGQAVEEEFAGYNRDFLLNYAGIDMQVKTYTV
jgi:hypothetical protein